jgi:hypothetical protein
MSNIIKSENNLIVHKNNKLVIPKELPISNKHREIFLSGKNFPKISEIQDMNVVVKQIHTFVNMTIMDKGVNMPPEEQTYLKQRVTEDIVRDFTRYTLEEIKLAFYYGVREEMGEYFGLNSSTFYKWLKNFRYELLPPAYKSVEKFLPKPENNQKPMSEKDFDRSVANTLIQEFLKLKNNDVYTYYDFGNIGYRFLEKFGFIKLDNKQKSELMSKSEEQFRANLIQRNKDLAMRGKSMAKLNLERSFKQIEEDSNPTFKNQIRIGAMRIAVYNFMKKVVDQKVNFENEVNKKIKEYNYDSNR